MQKDKFVEIGSFIAVSSLPVMVISAFPSASLKDIRWFSIGVMFFGIFYFGFLGVIFGRRMSNVADCLITIIFFGMALFVFFYGIALFMWHYDNNVLIDCYLKLAHFVDGIIK